MTPTEPLDLDDTEAALMMVVPASMHNAIAALIAAARQLDAIMKYENFVHTVIPGSSGVTVNTLTNALEAEMADHEKTSYQLAETAERADRAAVEAYKRGETIATLSAELDAMKETLAIMIDERGETVGRQLHAYVKLKADFDAVTAERQAAVERHANCEHFRNAFIEQVKELTARNAALTALLGEAANALSDTTLTGGMRHHETFIAKLNEAT